MATGLTSLVAAGVYYSVVESHAVSAPLVLRRRGGQPGARDDDELFLPTARRGASRTPSRWALSPVLDVVRDYRWGRVEETMGEDPYLVSMIGAAYVRGLEGAGIIATLKHFAGYSASRAARNHGPVPMGRRELMDMILPPFETAIALGGARSVMNSYSDVDGVPAGADPWLLTEVLREEWGFTGTVVSDYWAVSFLATMHRIAADTDEAGVRALAAGIDVELPDTLGFGRQLVERVRRGEIPGALIDRAARRLLTQKVQLGLLDPDWTPEKSVSGASSVDLDSPDNRALARELAERSIVLLDAGTALPLLGEGRTAPRRIAVAGPCADDPRTFMGCYAFPTHVLPRHPGLGLGVEAPSLLDALRAELPDAEIVHERGCDVQGDDRSGFAAAATAAREADLCVVAVGDHAGLFGHGTSGEGCDADDLRLPGVQEKLLAELAATGTPVVVVVVSGRPYALGAAHAVAAGLVQAFFPGEEGGHDVVAQVTRPVRQLTGFARIPLESGAEADVTFHVHADRTAFTGRDLRRIVEPGDIEVFAGTSAAEPPCQGRVRLTGPTRVVGHDRRLVTPVSVEKHEGSDADQF
ncbi:beta-glucosidase [Streptosporangium sp. CA-135522]|uniref:beta-glucosidase n=1 Tax=Streptosporangium sp. CA-135522 TaxID=3240072 RepID=UPI003D91E6E6